MPEYRVSQTDRGVKLSGEFWAETPEQAELAWDNYLAKMFGTSGRLFGVPVETERLRDNPKLFDVIEYYGMFGPAMASMARWGLTEDQATIEVIHLAVEVHGMESGMRVQYVPSRFRYVGNKPVVIRRKTMTWTEGDEEEPEWPQVLRQEQAIGEPE